MDFAGRLSVLVEEQPVRNRSRVVMVRIPNDARERMTENKRCLVMAVWN